VRDADRLIERLRDERRTPAASVRRRLSKKSRQLLFEHRSPDPVPELLLESLITDFNKIIEGRPLEIEKAEWRGVELREKTWALYARSPEADEKRYLNRLVIEDVFPQELARRDLLGIRFRTFTGRTYRYLVMPAYGLSLAAAVVAGMIIDLLAGALAWLRWRLSGSRLARRRGEGASGELLEAGASPGGAVARLLRWRPEARSLLMVAVFAAVCVHLLSAKGFGNWPPTSKPSEERALQ
jgi:hypothetical protein